MRICVVRIMIFGLSMIWTIPLYAGIGALPAFVELKGRFGQKLESPYTVYNTGEEPIEVEVHFRDYFRLDANKNIKTRDWLHVRPMKFKLGPKEQREVRCIVRVPQNAIGEVMTIVCFRAPSGPGSNVLMSFGTAFYVRVEGTEVVNGEIEGIDVAKVVVPTGNVPPHYSIGVRVRDNGNVHIRPRIKVDLYRDKENIKTVDFPFGWPVFPGSNYGYIGSWGEKDFRLTKGSYMAIAQVSFEGQVLTKKAAFFVDKEGNIRMK